MAADIYFHGAKTSRDEFEQSARRLASYFHEQGLVADDVIAVLMRNDLNFLIVAEAARYIGIRYVALNWHSVAGEVVTLMDDSGAKLLVAHDDLLDPVMSALPEHLPTITVEAPDVIRATYGLNTTTSGAVTALHHIFDAYDEWQEPAEKFRGMYAFTSGSTGKPKGIFRPTNPDAPDRWVTYAGLSRMMLKADAGDRFYCAAPLYHSAPNALAVVCLAAGDIDVFIDSKFDPEGFLATVERHKITHAYIVPTMMIRLLKLPEAVRTKYDVSSLRYTVSTGSPCPVDVKQAMIDWFGPIIHESYGASEIGFMTLISAPEALAKPGSVGRIFEGGAVKVLDDDGNEVPTGEVGTLYISLPLFGPYEYTNVGDEATDNRHGAFSTVGDMGYVDEDGFIFIMDRKKDMMISGGANIFPAEIEAQLILMPEIADCAVFGAPHQEFGEEIVAAVTLKDGASVTLDAVQSFLMPRLAKFKIPRKLDVHHELPRQDSGKIFKAKLRAPYWEGHDKQV